MCRTWSGGRPERRIHRRPRMISNRSVVACLFAVLSSFMTLSHANAGPTAPLAGNILYGTIAADRTLTAASPGPNYAIVGDLTIPAGVTLTIERGVALRVAGWSDY